jgi:osmotically-inducible protein OsmY
MKNENKFSNTNDKNERTIRSANSISQRMLLLCVALPLTLTTGYASDSSRRTDTTFFIDVPTPIVAPVSERQAADRVINHEIFRMALADTNADYNMIASANNGVVTLDVTSTNRFELQRVVNGMWQLRGVEQVKNERGVGVASTLAGKFTIAR